MNAGDCTISAHLPCTSSPSPQLTPLTHPCSTPKTRTGLHSMSQWCHFLAHSKTLPFTPTATQLPLHTPCPPIAATACLQNVTSSRKCSPMLGSRSFLPAQHLAAPFAFLSQSMVVYKSMIMRFKSVTPLHRKLRETGTEADCSSLRPTLSGASNMQCFRRCWKWALGPKGSDSHPSSAT